MCLRIWKVIAMHLNSINSRHIIVKTLDTSREQKPKMMCPIFGGFTNAENSGIIKMPNKLNNLMRCIDKAKKKMYNKM